MFALTFMGSMKLHESWLEENTKANFLWKMRHGLTHKSKGCFLYFSFLGSISHCFSNPQKAENWLESEQSVLNLRKFPRGVRRICHRVVHFPQTHLLLIPFKFEMLPPKLWLWSFILKCAGSSEENGANTKQIFFQRPMLVLCQICGITCLLQGKWIRIKLIQN